MSVESLTNDDTSEDFSSHGRGVLEAVLVDELPIDVTSLGKLYKYSFRYIQV